MLVRLPPTDGDLLLTHLRGTLTAVDQADSFHTVLSRPRRYVLRSNGSYATYSAAERPLLRIRTGHRFVPRLQSGSFEAFPARLTSENELLSSPSSAVPCHLGADYRLFDSLMRRCELEWGRHIQLAPHLYYLFWLSTSRKGRTEHFKLCASWSSILILPQDCD